MPQTAHRVSGPSRAAALLCASVIGLIVLTGCSQVSADDAQADAIVKEYVRSNDVAGDRLPTMDTPEDRLANLASMGPPQAVIGHLLQPVRCAPSGESSYGVDSPCDPAEEVLRAREAVSGPKAPLYGRSILVKRDDGTLELLTLYLVPRTGGTVALIDDQGGVFTGLEDFAGGTDTLRPGDRALMPQMITSLELRGEVVVVSPGGLKMWHWLLIAGALALVAVAVWAFIRRRVVAREAEMG